MPLFLRNLILLGFGVLACGATPDYRHEHFDPRGKEKGPALVIASGAFGAGAYRQQARRMAASLDVRSLRLLGDVLVQTGDNNGAVAAYSQARALLAEKDEPSLLLQLASALEQSGDWAQAKPLLEKVIERAPDSAAALNYIGYAMADRGEDLPRAIALLERANRIAPREPAFIDSLGWALYKAGQADKALPLIESAVSAAPGNAEINEHLGDILWALGRKFEARAAWRAALVGLDDDKVADKARARVTRKLDFGTESAAPKS